MSQDIQQYRQPEATPVGHAGTRVDIHERPAWAISGWAGVVVVAICIAAAILLGGGSVPALAAVPVVVGVVVLTSLVIVQPGHTKVVRFFGATSARYVLPASGGSCRWRTGGPSAFGSGISRPTI